MLTEQLLESANCSVQVVLRHTTYITLSVYSPRNGQSKGDTQCDISLSTPHLLAYYTLPTSF